MSAPDRHADPLAVYLAGTPCPSWCQHPAPHSYEHEPWETNPRHRWHRVHSRTLHTDTRWPLTLDLLQLDYATAPDQEPARHAPSYVLEVEPGCIELATPAELHDLAATLTALAELLELADPGSEGMR